MRAGVTIVDPATTYLVPGLHIAADVTIRPNTVIYGATRIGEGTSIGPNCRIGDATIGARCDIRESVVTSSEIANGVSIGPFAHLRGGSRLADGVRIGNFVELKNADLGRRRESEPPRVPGRLRRSVRARTSARARSRRTSTACARTAPRSAPT